MQRTSRRAATIRHLVRLAIAATLSPALVATAKEVARLGNRYGTTPAGSVFTSSASSPRNTVAGRSISTVPV